MRLILFSLFCLTAFTGEFTRIPIETYPFLSNQKYIKVQIEGKSYLSLIDTGGGVSLLRKDVMMEISDKIFFCESAYLNIYGNVFPSRRFKIPEVKIGDFVIASSFDEEHENFANDCLFDINIFISWKAYLMNRVFQKALIGTNIFKEFACIFDFPHASIFLAHEMSDLILDEDFFKTTYQAIPFEMKYGMIILRVDTDFGEKRLLLDSGCTKSILKLTEEEKQFLFGQKYFTSSRLVLNGLNVGSWTFRLLDFKPEHSQEEGILGIDFFNRYVIALDFQKSMAYIYCPEMGSKERLTYWLKSYFGY